MPLPLHRKLLFSSLLLGLGLAALLAVNALVQLAEDRDLVSTHRQDALVQYVEGELFHLDESRENWVSTEYLAMSAPPQTIPTHKGDAWRFITTGGSLVRGMPYGEADGTELAGTMQFWLRQRLGERYPEAQLQVVNLGASGQSSQRVKGFVAELVQMQPDLMFIATCNNEGALPPGAVMEYLHEQAAYRLLTKWLVPEPEVGERTTFMLQDPNTEAVRAAFRRNLEEIVATTGEAGVPVLLATLPVRLRYAGDDWGNVLEQGFLNSEGGHEGRRNADACILEAIRLYEANDCKQAVAQLEQCENKAEALRWRGLCAYRRYRFDDALAMLEQSVELIPRGRCRPSFNEIIRDVATAEGAEHVRLVDLDLATRAIAPHGIPGPEQFHDNCHLTWTGYEAMAREVQSALEDHDLVPPGQRSDQPMRDRLTIAQEHDLLATHDPRIMVPW